MEFEKHRFNPVNASDEEWEQFDVYTTKMHNFLTPEDPREPKEKRKQSLILQAESKEIEFELYLLKDEMKQIIGIFVMASFHRDHPSYEANAALLLSEISLLPEYRGKGIAKKLMKDLYNFSIANNKHVIISNSIEKTSVEFIEHIGGIVAQRNIENRAYLDKIDWDMIDEWIENGENKNPEVRLEFFEVVPEDMMDKFIAYYNETMNQIPKDEIEMEDITFDEKTIRDEEKRMKELGRKKVTAITLEKNGDISSLSELIYSPTNRTKVEQGLTSTLEKYRGNGLGKWIKAVMLKKARNEFEGAEFITTHNATSNGPMLHINEKIGFKVHKEVYTLQITVEQLGVYINK